MFVLTFELTRVDGISNTTHFLGRRAVVRVGARPVSFFHLSLTWFWEGQMTAVTSATVCGQYLHQVYEVTWYNDKNVEVFCKSIDAEWCLL
jgi:hypothetical protein